MKSRTAGRQGAIQIESSQRTASTASFGQPNLNPEQVLGRFSDVAILAADWFWEINAELRFTYQSSRFEEITGIPVAEVIGKTREQAFADRIDDVDKWSRVGEALQQRGEYEMVWSLRRPDGDIRVLRTRGKPFFDNAGRFMGYRGVGSDISEAVSAQQQLVESENRFKNIIDHVTDIVCIASVQGEIKFLNNAVEKLLGYRVDELEPGKAGDHADASANPAF